MNKVALEQLGEKLGVKGLAKPPRRGEDADEEEEEEKEVEEK